MPENPNETQQKIDELEIETVQPDFWNSKGRPQDILKQLRELEEEKAKQEREKNSLVPKDIFLIITSDASIFDPNLPAGQLILDISSIVPELHIVFIGKRELQSKKINNNTYIYTARNIPFFNLLTVYKVIAFQLVWRGRFLPTTIVSIGDDINIAKIFSWRYGRPLYVFYAYMKVLGRGRIPMSSLLTAAPEKIIVPNRYIEEALQSHSQFKQSRTKTKILPEYIKVPEYEDTFNLNDIEQNIKSRNELYSMLAFPRYAGFSFFSTLKKISKEISTSIIKFQFTIVVKQGQFLQAKMLGFLFNLPVLIIKEKEDSVNLFHKAHLMLYFDNKQTTYEPIFYSLISGCPVLSSGDEYSKIILFGSEFEEFISIERNGRAFGLSVKKLINNPYLYKKYKMNCVGFAKSAFTHDHDSFIVGLRDSLNTKN